jgi:hypothetical protein
VKEVSSGLDRALTVTAPTDIGVLTLPVSQRGEVHIVFLV